MANHRLLASLSTAMEGCTVSACSAITKTRSAWNETACDHTCTCVFTCSLPVQPETCDCELARNEADVLH